MAEKWGLTLRVSHGFGSVGMEQQIGSYFESLDKEITVFYLGDHDPSGHSIEEDIHRRVETASGVSFEMKRLAIDRYDIRRSSCRPKRSRPATAGPRGSVASSVPTRPPSSWMLCQPRSYVGE